MNTKTLLKKISVVAMTSVLMVGTTFSLTGCGQTSSSKTASDASSASEDLTTIRIGVMTGDLSQEAVEIGIDKGIFENYGLDVKVTEYAAGINTVDALTMNNEDMGIVADYAWVNRLGTVADKTTLRLFTRYSTSTGEGNVLVINKKLASGVDELSGQKIATIAGTVWDYFVGKLIEEKGLKDVTIVKTSSAAEMYAAYSSGKVAAFFASGETLTKATADKNTIKALTLKDLGLSIDEYYAANESYLKENPETVKKFLQAQEDIYKYISDNEADAASIVENKLAIPASTFTNGLKSWKLDLTILQESVDRLNEINKWAKAQGNYELTYDAGDFMYTDILKSLYPDNVDL